MTVFIGYESAYEFWRRADDSRGSALCASRARPSHRLRVVDAKGRATRPEIGDMLFRGLFISWRRAWRHALVAAT